MMFWKKVRPAIDRQWIEHLEAGERSDPTLRLADQLRQTPPVAPPLSAAFQTKLRNRLVNQHPTQRQPLRLAMRLAWAGLALLLLVGGGATLLRFGLRYPGWQPTVSTTPHPSIAQTTSVADSSTVIYDRAQLDWTENGKPVSAIGESWYTADGKNIRYQLTSASGVLLMFYQDDGNSIVMPTNVDVDRSDQTITLLHREMNTQGIGMLQAWQDPSMLLPAPWYTLRVLWPVLLYNIRAKQTTCHSVFCLLGVNASWQCHEHQCSTEDVRIEGTRQIAQIGEEVVDGRRIGNFEFLYTTYGGGKRHLQIDLDTFSFLALDVYEQGTVHTRIQNFETQTLRRSELPVDFFSTVPVGMTVQPRPTQPWDTTFHLGDIRAEILDVSPVPGSISQPATITLQLRYAISPSVENMEFAVDLLPLGVEQWLLPPGFHQTIQPATDTGVITLKIPVQPDTIRPGRWRLEISAVDTTNQSSWTLPNIQGYTWCIACLAEGEQLTVDRAFRTGSKDRILLNIAGRTMLPTVTCINTQLLADGEPVAWWPTDTCVIVRDRRWNFYVPLYKTGAPGQLTPGVTYTLRAWQRYAPATEAVKEFADLAGEIN